MINIDIKAHVLRQPWFQIMVFAGFCITVGIASVPKAEQFVKHEAEVVVQEHVLKGAHDEANLNHQSMLELQYTISKSQLRSEIRDMESRIFTRNGAQDDKTKAEVRYYEVIITDLNNELDDLEPKINEVLVQKAFYKTRIQERTSSQ